jgi:hypothetical protein
MEYYKLGYGVLEVYVSKLKWNNSVLLHFRLAGFFEVAFDTQIIYVSW